MPFTTIPCEYGPIAAGALSVVMYFIFFPPYTEIRDLCSLLFLLAITFQFVSAKKFPTRTNFIFTLILLCSLGSLATDLLGCLTVMHVIKVPLWLNYLINGSFYFLQITIPGLTCIYVLVATGVTYKKNPRIFLVMVPAVAFMLLQILNPFTKMFFYFANSLI